MFDARLLHEDSGDVVHLFPVPSTVTSEVDVDEYEWKLYGGPSIRAPRGANPKTHHYSSFFPDAHDVGEPYCPDDWRPPRDLGYQLNLWMQQRHTLRLLVTDTSIDAIVYIQSLHEEWGELGRMRYELTLVEFVEITIDALSLQEATADGTNSVGPDGTLSVLSFGGRRVTVHVRKPAPTPARVTVKAGQTLPILAKLYLDNSARWPEIVAANRNTLAGVDLNRLPAGMVLSIPGGTVPTESVPTYGTER